jgi:predicted phage terminase large subunit-like protein
MSRGLMSHQHLDQFAISESELIRSLFRESLYQAIRISWPVFADDTPVWNWHIKYLADEIQKVMTRAIQGKQKEYDLIINLPPGMTKSTIFGVIPAWVWSIWPGFRSINASYVHTLSVKSNVKTRDIIQSDWYQDAFPEVRLREDLNTKQHFGNTKNGERMAVGVGGYVTGFHGHALFWDDLLNPKEAASDTVLEETNRWMDEVYSSRMVNKMTCPIIGIQQRVHENDPTGHRMKKAAKQGSTPVKLICLPATDEYPIKPKRMRKFYVGGCLDPKRLPKAQCEAIRVDQGDYVYAGQYGQQPSPRGGGLLRVERVHKITHVPDGVKFSRIVRFWDKAGSKRKTSAWTVGVKMALREEQAYFHGTPTIKRTYYILGVERFREEAAKREQIILNTAQDDGVKVQVRIEQEPGSGGLESAENTIQNLLGYDVAAVLPRGDKIQRADRLAVAVNNGYVFIVDGPNTEDLLSEWRYFPNSTYKDCTDASSGAFKELSEQPEQAGLLS